MNLVTLKDATNWAKNYLDREVSTSNISYLVNYGKVRKHGKGTNVLVNLDELKKYYDSIAINRKSSWKDKLGEDLNWSLSFDNLREKDTTKHVHRLHPYKGKYIPQLVEYFLDNHTDQFKKKIYFKKGDIILDPFLGSGTTLIQANEMGMHGVGVDVSVFNCLVSKAKIQDYDLDKLKKTITTIAKEIKKFEELNNINDFDNELLKELSKFNKKHFPSPEFKYQLSIGKIKEKNYVIKKEQLFLPIYKKLLKKYNLNLESGKKTSFIDKWYINSVRAEIDFIYGIINKEKDETLKEILSVILSRAVRSSRATTHSDLATLKNPQFTTYYCFKHRKICKPMFSMLAIFNRYASDTLKRIEEFSKLKTKSKYLIIDSDSRTVDIYLKAKEKTPDFYNLLTKKKIKGIFSSPPYVGQIDYHEQHSYAYNLFDLPRKDESEIGPLYKGTGIKARESYVEGIAAVLNNCKKFFVKDYDVFLVANDKHNLYPLIAERSGMVIVDRFKRPVLNRTERDRNPYSEIIFHLKKA